MWISHIQVEKIKTDTVCLFISCSFLTRRKESLSPAEQVAEVKPPERADNQHFEFTIICIFVKESFKDY